MSYVSNVRCDQCRALIEKKPYLTIAAVRGGYRAYAQLVVQAGATSFAIDPDVTLTFNGEQKSGKRFDFCNADCVCRFFVNP